MTEHVTTTPRRECPIARHRAVDCPSDGVCRFAQQLPLTPFEAVDILTAHQRQGSRGCSACGDLPLGSSFAQHQAGHLAAAGLFRPDAPTPAPAEPVCEHGSTLDALCKSMTGYARGIPQPPHAPTPAGDDQREALAWAAAEAAWNNLTTLEQQSLDYDWQTGYVAGLLAARPSASGAK